MRPFGLQFGNELAGPRGIGAHLSAERYAADFREFARVRGIVIPCQYHCHHHAMHWTCRIASQSCAASHRGSNATCDLRCDLRPAMRPATCDRNGSYAILLYGMGCDGMRWDGKKHQAGSDRMLSSLMGYVMGAGGRDAMPCHAARQSQRPSRP
eukprot:2884238-Pyramimonas_sp.AAC.1